jgi:hypothetical protein
LHPPRIRRLSPFACGTVLAAVIALPSAAATLEASTQASRLTGFGATRQDWAAHHVADPNPKLVRGCCFLPRQKDGYDRYYDVGYDKGRVVAYGMDFLPRVRASIARLLMKEELPPDTRVVAHAKRGTCELIEYRSPTLKKLLGSPKVGVEFSSDQVNGPYQNVVRDVTVAQYLVVKGGC